MRSIPLLILAGCVTSSLLAQGKDIIVRKNGARIRGIEVTEFTHSGLKATRKGGEVLEIPGHLVLALEWGDLPEEFIAGRAAMERGDFATAVQMFGEAANKATRPLVKADCEFFQIKAAVAAIGDDSGAAQTAADKAKAWLTTNGDHWRVPEALLLAGRASRLAGNAADATATLRELDDRATREGFGAVWSARAKFELALTLMAEDKAGEARSIFQSANSAADNALRTPSGDDSELRTIKIMAKIGEGETYLSEKDYSRAESFFHALTNNKDNNALVAAAWAGEGQAIFLQAKDTGSSADFRRAQLALARASVLDSQAGEASAKANYYLGRCQLELGPDREGDKFKTRARAYFQIVLSNYSSSRWAAEAKAALAQ